MGTEAERSLCDQGEEAPTAARDSDHHPYMMMAASEAYCSQSGADAAVAAAEFDSEER